VEQNGENGILNRYHMSEINHFKKIIMQNDVADDVERMLMCHDLIEC
jgi:fructose-specific phosphotransferase system component IIB